jgi:hypothetical protein
MLNIHHYLLHWIYITTCWIEYLQTLRDTPWQTLQAHIFKFSMTRFMVDLITKVQYGCMANSRPESLVHTLMWFHQWCVTCMTRLANVSEMFITGMKFWSFRRNEEQCPGQFCSNPSRQLHWREPASIFSSLEWIIFRKRGNFLLWLTTVPLWQKTMYIHILNEWMSCIYKNISFCTFRNWIFLFCYISAKSWYYKPCNFRCFKSWQICLLLNPRWLNIKT